MRKGQQFTPIYLLIIIAIAIVVVISMIKPMFRRAGRQVELVQPLTQTSLVLANYFWLKLRFRKHYIS